MHRMFKSAGTLWLLTAVPALWAFVPMAPEIFLVGTVASAEIATEECARRYSRLREPFENALSVSPFNRSRLTEENFCLPEHGAQCPKFSRTQISTMIDEIKNQAKSDPTRVNQINESRCQEMLGLMKRTHGKSLRDAAMFFVPAGNTLFEADQD